MLRFVVETVLWISVSLILLVVVEVKGHVTLTFPPARKLEIDFLNNFWTKGPCGMPSGSKNFSTILQAGSTFNVNWQLGYSHIGGYRIELLDNRDQKIMDLTATNSPDGFVQGNATAQWHKVRLPDNFVCRDCTIRLLRQVKSFSPDFNFWSCSDVNIVPPSEYTENCSNKGALVRGKCRCADGYWGKICQYQDECGTDAQCGGSSRGKCLYMGATNLPRRQCYCKHGYHGEGCSLRNNAPLPVPSHSLNLSGHTLQVLSDRMLMYYKIIPNNYEIEIVLLVNGTTYAGVGWKPLTLGPICKSWPFIPDALGVNSNTIDVTNKNRRQSQSQSAPTGSPWAAQDIYSAMDCTDLIIGTAKGGYSRVRDYYARGRHTPLEDSKWGGRNDITAATGWEHNGVTTIIFRRKLRAVDITDHSLDKGEMLVIWARGQEPSEHIKKPSDRLEQHEHYVSKFYVRDELKYHGLGDQKGFIFLDFLAGGSSLPRRSSGRN